MNLTSKIKTCIAVLKGHSIIFNTSFYGKVRIKMNDFPKGKTKLFIQDNKFYDDIITDKVVVYPDDLRVDQVVEEVI